MKYAYYEKNIKTNVLPFMFFGCAVACMFLLCLKGEAGVSGKNTLDIALGDTRLFVPAGKFILLFSATWVICMVMFLVYPRGMSRASAGMLILVPAMLCRMALFAHDPSDDMNRYLWEGRMIKEGVNPYRYAPDDIFFSGYAKDDPFHSH